MALRADDQGFLIGDGAADTGMDSMAKAMPVINSIRRDTAAIRSALRGNTDELRKINAARGDREPVFSDQQVRNLANKIAEAIATRDRSGTRSPSAARERDERGRFRPPAPPSTPGRAPASSAQSDDATLASASGQPASTQPPPAPVPPAPDAPPAPPAPVPPAPDAPPAPPAPVPPAPDAPPAPPAPVPPAPDAPPVPPAPVPPATPRLRDSRGRFRRDEDRDDGGDDDGEKGGLLSKAGEKIGAAADSLKDTATGLADTAEAIDPVVTATKEVTEIVGPLVTPLWSMTKGFFGLFRKDKDAAIPWYRKIWKKLKEIHEDQGDGQGAGGGFMGRLMAMFSGMFAGIGGALAGGLPGGLALLRGAITKALLPLGGIFTAVTGFRTTTEEYAARMGVELNGSLAQELGVRFVGVLGDLGNNLTLGLAGKLGEAISPAIGDAIDHIKAGWTATTDLFKAAADGVTEKWNATIEWFTSKWDAAITLLTDFIEGVTEFGKETKETVIRTTETVIQKVGDAKESAGGWVGDKWDATKSAFGGGSAGNKAALEAEATRAGITDPTERAMFMAQMHHESGGFRTMEESFKYRSPERLMEVSATARNAGREKVEAAMNAGPEAVAELMYGGRMGNTQLGDAHKYRGRGHTQLTGKANYEKASAALGIDLVNNPDQAADPEVAAKIATWYWKDRGLSADAKAGNVAAVTQKINGGQNGAADRAALFREYSAQQGVTQPAVAAAPPIMVPQSPLMPVAAPAVASVTAPQMASAAPTAGPVKIPDPEPVRTQVASTNKGGRQTVVNVKEQLTQNLRDRGIAHVVTGGLGGNGVY